MYFTFLALCSQLALVDLLLSKCCGNLTSGCWQMIHHPPETDPEQLLSTVKDSHLIYPVLVDKQDMASENHHLIGLVPPGSIAFVVPKGERDNYPKKLMMAVFEAWPVLILTILLSILAGVFLWLLVSVYLFFLFLPCDSGGVRDSEISWQNELNGKSVSRWQRGRLCLFNFRSNVQNYVFYTIIEGQFLEKNCNDFVTFVSLPGSLLAGRSNLFTVCQFSVCSSLGIVTTVQSIIVGNLETLIGQFFTLWSVEGWRTDEDQIIAGWNDEERISNRFIAIDLFRNSLLLILSIKICWKFILWKKIDIEIEWELLPWNFW